MDLAVGFMGIFGRNSSAYALIVKKKVLRWNGTHSLPAVSEVSGLKGFSEKQHQDHLGIDVK